jgi:hypothetical protein
MTECDGLAKHEEEIWMEINDAAKEAERELREEETIRISSLAHLGAVYSGDTHAYIRQTGKYGEYNGYSERIRNALKQKLGVPIDIEWEDGANIWKIHDASEVLE